MKITFPKNEHDYNHYKEMGICDVTVRIGRRKFRKTVLIDTAESEGYEQKVKQEAIENFEKQKG